MLEQIRSVALCAAGHNHKTKNPHVCDVCVTYGVLVVLTEALISFCAFHSEDCQELIELRGKKGKR